MGYLRSRIQGRSSAKSEVLCAVASNVSSMTKSELQEMRDHYESELQKLRDHYESELQKLRDHYESVIRAKSQAAKDQIAFLEGQLCWYTKGDIGSKDTY